MQLAKLTGNPGEVTPLPVEARYPWSQVRGEIIKAAIGMAFCLGFVAVVQPAAWLAWVLVALAAMFALYLWQQVLRTSLRFRLDDAGVTRHGRGGGPRTLAWSALDDFRLNFYAHGRKARQGTLAVVLHQGKLRLKADSNLDHFPTLLQRAARAARENGLELHPTTVANLEQLEL